MRQRNVLYRVATMLESRHMTASAHKQSSLLDTMPRNPHREDKPKKKMIYIEKPTDYSISSCNRPAASARVSIPFFFNIWTNSTNCPDCACCWARVNI